MSKQTEDLQEETEIVSSLSLRVCVRVCVFLLSNKQYFFLSLSLRVRTLSKPSYSFVRHHHSFHSNAVVMAHIFCSLVDRSLLFSMYIFIYLFFFLFCDVVFLYKYFISKFYRF